MEVELPSIPGYRFGAAVAPSYSLAVGAGALALPTLSLVCALTRQRRGASLCSGREAVRLLLPHRA